MFSKNKPSSSILTNHLCKCHRAFQLLLLIACCSTFSTALLDPANGQVAASKADEDKSGPENVTLETKDKVELVCTYFPPAAKKSTEGSGAAASDTKSKPTAAAPLVDGKRIIPYIILHDWESSRADTQALATFLSAQGNAVITPDLRGHGDSTRVVGVKQPIDAADFNSGQIFSTMEDIEACKRFLVKRNNAGELNVDMLAVIAIGKTVPMATQWVVDDWTKFAPYKNGIKQGQDVKFLIMIAPEKKFGSFAMTRITSAPIFAGETALPTIVSWGTSSKDAKENESIYTRLEKKRPNPKNKSGDAQTLFKAPLKSSLSGEKIGSNSKLTKLWQFFDKTVSDKINQNLDKVPWQDRSKKP